MSSTVCGNQQREKRLVLRRLLVCRLHKLLSGPITSKAGPPRRGSRSSRDGDGVHAMDERAVGGSKLSRGLGPGGWVLGPGGWVWWRERWDVRMSTHCGGGEICSLHLLAIAMAGRMMELHTVLWILVQVQIV